jgi:hypothetical protein
MSRATKPDQPDSGGHVGSEAAETNGKPVGRKPTGAATTSERRVEARRELRAPCEVWIFDASGKRERLDVAYARSYSFRGLSFVAHLKAPLPHGQPVETAIAMPGNTQMHAAGTVAYCRSIADDQYEVGIRVRAVGSYSILSGDLQSKKALYEWFADALQRASAILPRDS